MSKENLKVYPFSAAGDLHAAASKSAMQRVCALALLHEGATTITNRGESNDDLAALDIIQQLGATVIDSATQLEVTGVKQIRGESINAGESGLSVRMFTPIASLSETEITVNGTGSLLNRPLDMFEAVFPQLQVKISTTSGKLPLTLQGPMVPCNIELDGSLSSQFLTGFLIAFANAVIEQTTITVHNLKSRPYIDLTLSLMKDFGYQVDNNDYKSFLVYPKNIVHKDLKIAVEGDWSGAAFLLVAAAISGKVSVSGLQQLSTQGDKRIQEALVAAGASVTWNDNKIQVRKNELIAFNFDATECPDLFPPLVALAACCSGTSVIIGTKRLTHKESNRAITLQEEFAKLGVIIHLAGDEMHIEGSTRIKGGNVYTHEDHRIAMALAVVATVTKEPIILEDARVVNKSYPGFYKHLEQLGATIENV